jgi:TolB-like protein/class 3 adenylate cyclase/Flp pilus assembly protein TadD
MTEQRVERRLAAILAADVVGYSRLMEHDETGTLAALKGRRRNVVEPIVARNRGRIFKVTGDGVLVEFASAVNAVQCAIDIQHGMAAANGDLPDDRHIVLRMGVNLGDVMIEATDVYGEGVNIAARLESMADPGGILVSSTAYDFVRNKVGSAFDDLGARVLKNIAEPVRAYRVVDLPPVSVAASPPRIDKLSVAVLPFANKSDDPGQEYFADGITEDIITELSRFRSLLVMSPESLFTYKGRAVSPQAAGRNLGVEYVVEGSVRRAAKRVRVTAQLIEASSGNHLWAEHYDRELADIFAVQDEIAQSIVANIAGRLDEAGGERALRKRTEHLSIYDLLLQGRHLANRGSKDEVLQARDLFLRALETEPDNVRAQVGLAYTFILETSSGWAEAPRESARRAFELGRRAVELDNRDSEAHLVLAWGYFRAAANFELAASQIDNAIRLNPNDCNNYCFKSWLLTCSGDPAGSIVCANEALRRNPLAPNDCLYTIGVADYLAGRYEQALSVLGQVSASRQPQIHAWMAACYAELGRDEDARRQADEYRHSAALKPQGSPAQDTDTWRAYWTSYMPFKDAARLETLLNSLRKAGLPK